MLASLFGALVGGLLALVGGWLGLHWHAQREARGVAGALLAELSVAERMMAKGGWFYQEMLDGWKATGEVLHRQAVVDMFENDPQDTLPVYFSMTGKLGLLPKDLATDIVQYHASIIALPRMIVRFLGRQELEKPNVKALAESIEKQFHENNRTRTRLIAELAEFVSRPVGLLPSRDKVAGPKSAAAPPAEQPSSRIDHT